ncbi:hypothetical protein [Micromonospora sp. WMMC273]|uniref:hypothetical protein n=1 Tax=Micromonospora sp. WMMC273 TaxID=3015157 RepID=UPI0022B6085E|nr:hypothetical protein [Micromonospora sp. WMMC273]MCZ7478868.1 hypothetical protein [Micromonospora sp. WMMC273]MCZ7478977.1 hypothetical protein [Micromonospora sp. WMMC273]
MATETALTSTESVPTSGPYVDYRRRLFARLVVLAVQQPGADLAGVTTYLLDRPEFTGQAIGRCLTALHLTLANEWVRAKTFVSRHPDVARLVAED